MPEREPGSAGVPGGTMPDGMPMTMDWGVLLIVAALFVVNVVLMVRIVRRAGRSGWWVVLMTVPLVNIAMLWVFAFTRWPRVDPPARG
jgi:uncharacterized membrane protein YhaH (DUF805 family)